MTFGRPRTAVNAVLDALHTGPKTSHELVQALYGFDVEIGPRIEAMRRVISRLRHRDNEIIIFDVVTKKYILMENSDDKNTRSFFTSGRVVQQFKQVGDDSANARRDDGRTALP